MDTATARICQRCGIAIPPAAPRGLCPACLLGSALLPPAGPRPEGDAVLDPTGLPRRFAGYDLLEELGRGGQGIVFKARQLGLNRIVAVKVLRGAAFANPESVARFRTEAEATAALRHPNIVTIHEVGEHEGQPFYSMDFIAGRDLAQVAAEGPVAPLQAARWVQTVALAVQAAHGRGVLHRDLKPSNVLVDDTGSPRVTDFGLAKRLTGDTSGDITLSQQALGSPNYMPPEQASRRYGPVGPHSDVYGLGAILYHLLTGRPPLEGDSTAELLRLVIDADPIPARRLRPTVPANLETICLKCLRKDSSRRYATAQEVADELGRFLNGEPIHARPATPAERAWLWCRRRPAQATALATIGLLLLTLAIGGPLAAFRINRSRLAAEHAESQRRAQLREALLAQARAIRQSGRVGQRFAALEAVREATRIQPGLDLRNEAIAALALPDMRETGRWQARTNLSSVLAFDPDRHRYAVEAEPGRIELRHGPRGSLLGELRGPPSRILTSPIFSADGRFLAGRLDTNSAVVWDLDRSQLLFTLTNRPYILKGRMTGYGQPDAFSGDSRWLASALPAGGASIHRVPEGAEVRRFATSNMVTHLAFSPDASLLAVGRGLRNTGQRTGMFLLLVDPVTGETRRSLAVREPFQVMEWSDDGRYLVAGTEALEVFNVANGEVVTTIRDPNVAWAAFGPEPGMLLTRSENGPIALWDLKLARRVLFGQAGEQPAVAIDRTRSRLWVSAQLLEAAEFTLEMPRVMRFGVPETDSWENVDEVGVSVDYSPDGALLVTAIWGAILLRDAESGRVLAELRQGASNNRVSALFAPDGQAVWACSHSLGLARVPLARGTAGQPSLGAAEVVDAEEGFLLSDQSPNGSRLLLTSRSRGQVKVVPSQGATPAVRWAMASPTQARFVAGGATVVVNGLDGLGREPLRLWDAQTGRPVRELPAAVGHRARTSRDRRWLATANGERRSVVWKTDSWQMCGPLPEFLQGAARALALSATGELLAAAEGSRVHLVNPATGAILAALDASASGGYVADMAFSPNGQQLAVHWDYGPLSLWDLRTLRRELTGLGLDW